MSTQKTLVNAPSNGLGPGGSAELVDGIPAVVWMTCGDPGASNARLHFVSSYVETLLGYAPDECLRTPDVWRTIVHPEDRARVESAAALAFAEGHPHIDRFRWTTKDGRTLWVESRASVITDGAGQPIGLCGVTVDVSERQRIEDELRQIQRPNPDTTLLASIVESSFDAIVTKDLNGIVTSWNAAAEALFGYAADEIIGKPVRLLIPPERQSEEDDILAKIRRGERIEHFETERIGKHGTRLNISLTISPVRDAAGAIVGASKIARNVTDVKRAEAERLQLLEENAVITASVNRVGTIIASDLDRERVVQAVTDAATELTTAEFGGFFYNVLSETGESYMLHSISGVPRDAFSTLRVPGSTEAFESIFTGADTVRSADITQDPRYEHGPPHPGTPHGHLPVRSHLAVRVRGRDGEVIGGLFFGHSAAARFTEHHERLATGVAAWASVALENARLFTTVREASQLKDEFLASLSHELRTPLNAIVGYARLLQAGMVAPDKQVKAIETIERNANSLTQIVEDILDTSRIVSGKLRLHVQAVDLPQMVRNAIDSVAVAADAKGVRLEAVLDPQAGPVSGDPERLQQVLWNLLTNAVKFTGRGGKVQVRLERVNSEVEVSVADTGIGISREFLPHVFERFRQADASTARERGGLGLGLSIARELIEMDGGTIDVSSAGRGAGTAFRVRLPLIVAHPTRAASGPAHPRAVTKLTPMSDGDLGGVHVLVVDDDPDSVSLVAELLGSAGARVSSARSAGAALHLIETDVPDVLVTDLGMPGMDGYQLIERIRAHPNLIVRRMPAAALTAYARSEDRVKVLRAGFQNHLAKPVDPYELVTTVASLASRFAPDGPGS